MKAKALILKAASGKDSGTAGSNAKLWEGACEWEVGSTDGGRKHSAAGMFSTLLQSRMETQSSPESTATSSTKTLTKHKGFHFHRPPCHAGQRAWHLGTQLQ